MRTNFKMKEATNKEEAIISILDVVEENPVWLNKITDSLLILVRRVEDEHKRFLLDRSIDEEVIKLYRAIKTEYYIFQDVTRWKN